MINMINFPSDDHFVWKPYVGVNIVSRPAINDNVYNDTNNLHWPVIILIIYNPSSLGEFLFSSEDRLSIP